MAHKLAFLGLGVMGYPMAGHLAKAGHTVTVYNRTAKKADDWLREYSKAGDGGHASASTPAEAVAGAEVAFACVGNDHDIAQICLGDDGAFAGLSAKTVFVDHTTASARIARDLADRAREKDIEFLDAPVSGGEAGAQNGQLTIMVGGSKTAYRRAQPVMDAYAKKVKLMGSSGAGQTTKMVNQICIAGIVQGLSEALHFCLEAGLDADEVVEVISKGAAQSWQMDNRAHTMVRGEFDFGFAVDWMRKDLDIVLDEARRLDVSLPLTALVDQFYQDVQNMGGGRNDTSSLIRRFRD